MSYKTVEIDKKFWDKSRKEWNTHEAFNTIRKKVVQID